MPNLSSHIQTFSVFDAPYAGHDLILESLDGFEIEKVGNSSVEYFTNRWNATVGPPIDQSIFIAKKDSLPLYPYTWNKRRQLRIGLASYIENDPIGEYHLFTGDVTSPFLGFGLLFKPTQIKAWAGNGVNHTEIILFDALTPGVNYEHLYELVFYPGNGLYVYADVVLAGSITTNLPTGTNNADDLIAVSMLNGTEGTQSVLAFSRIQFSQDN